MIFSFMLCVYGFMELIFDLLNTFGCDKTLNSYKSNTIISMKKSSSKCKGPFTGINAWRI